MSTRKLYNANLAPRKLSSNVDETDDWLRNPAWLAMPSVTSADAKVAGLYAVWPESNFLAMTCAGNYTVDWGDGTAPENVSSGVSAYHEYDYADSDLANTNGPVTFTDSGDLVNRTAHGHINGQPVSFYNIVSTTGLNASQTYYVINASTNSFQVSDELNGSAVALTTDGSGALLPYKQAMVVITPNGGTLTQVNLNVLHNKTGLVSAQTNVAFLELLVGGKDFNSTGMTLGASVLNVRFASLERFVCVSFGSQSSLANFFQDCFALRSIALGETTAAVTNMSFMFSACHRLKVVPYFNTSSATTMTATFSTCRSLVSVALLNTAAVTEMDSMFDTATALKRVPLFNTAAVTTMLGMFSGAGSLIEVPLFNTANVTLMTSMFNGCSSLETVPKFDMSSMLSLNSMFAFCQKLKRVPLFNTATVTNMGAMFATCSSLKSCPPFNTAAVTSFASMFNGATSLHYCPPLDTSAGTAFNSMFQTCRALKSVPKLNTALATTIAIMFANCNLLTEIPALSAASVTNSAGLANLFLNSFSISKISITGLKFTFTVDSCRLSSAALDALYTALDTVVGQTLTVTNNHGIAADTPSIATAKGWTVTG